MIDCKPFEPDRLLTCSLDDLIAAVRPMSAKDCEYYTRVILGRVGGPTFEQYLMRLVKTMIPEHGSGPPTSPNEYYFAVRGLFPHIPKEDDILGRLALFAMRMCQLRMEDDRKITKH